MKRENIVKKRKYRKLSEKLFSLQVIVIPIDVVLNINDNTFSHTFYSIPNILLYSFVEQVTYQE